MQVEQLMLLIGNDRSYASVPRHGKEEVQLDKQVIFFYFWLVTLLWLYMFLYLLYIRTCVNKTLKVRCSAYLLIQNEEQDALVGFRGQLTNIISE